MTLLDRGIVRELDDTGLAERPEDDQPLKRRRFTVPDLIDVGCAVLAATALGGILREILGWQGVMSTALWVYVFFLGAYYLLQRQSGSPEAGADRVITAFVWSVGVLVIGALTWMLAYLVAKGLHDLSASFFTQDMSKVGPLNSGGGAKAAIIGTAEQVGIATAVVVPLGVFTAIYLHEHRGKLARPIRFFVDALSGKPSILAGLVIYSAWIIGHPNRFSGVADSAALLILMLPTVTVASEEVLRTIPDPLREASLALGAPQWRTVMRVVVPTALSGLTTATLLAIARAVGETAPGLVTAGYTTRTNINPFHGPQANLPLFVYNLVFVPNKAQNDRAWTAALILVILVLVLFAGARFVTSRGQRKRGRAS